MQTIAVATISALMFFAGYVGWIDSTASAVMDAAYQQAPEAYPGQRQHKEPPKGWFCAPTGKDAAKNCHCKRMGHPTKEDPDCEFLDEVVNDSTCTVYCWETGHCLCHITCENPAHHHEIGKAHE